MSLQLLLIILDNFQDHSQFATLMNTIQAAVAGGERVFEIMDEVPEIQNKKMQYLYKIYKDMLGLKVSFGYAQDNMILKDVSLEANPGRQSL